MSCNQNINFDKYNWKSYLLRHINLVIAHKNLILLKQEFSLVAFLQHMQGRNKTPREGPNARIVSVDI